MKTIPKNIQESQLFINPKNYKYKRNKNNRIKYIINKNHPTNIIIIIIIIIIILLLLIIIFIKNIPTFFKKDNKKNILINIKTKSDKDFSKYKKMFPHLTPNLKDIISSTEEIFTSRVIYISDIRITPDYIKYIRYINETNEEKYKKPFSENKTIIDKNLYSKKPDQYNYVDYCKYAINETLIDKKKLQYNKDYNNNPLISVVVPSYNKQNLILKTIRSIQNQNLKNIEIIIVNDCSTDNSSLIFNYLLKTDPRIRIFNHMKNMGCWRSRLDGILYSRGKYIILFDGGDLYEDNYVLSNGYDIMEKYNLDSLKFLFRGIWGLNHINSSQILFHAGYENEIAYGLNEIKALNYKVFTQWGNIWNRLVRANIYIKGLLLLNELMLNVHKNMWDDGWFNEIVHRASYSFGVIERVGYVYCQTMGEGTPKYKTEEQRSKATKEFLGFLYFDYNFCENNGCKSLIVNNLRNYNESFGQKSLKNLRNHFEVLYDLLETLIKDKDIKENDKKFCEKLLDEYKSREKDINGMK